MYIYFKYSRNPCALVKGRLVQLLWKTVWSFLKKLKMDVPFDLVMPLLRIYLKKSENTTLKEYTHPYVHCSIIYNSQDLEAAQVSISRHVDRNAVVHLYNGILLGHKK